ncbi:MAG TPA: nucleotidyltransferase domain-containing protein [Ktedonobacterales bacterium]
MIESANHTETAIAPIPWLDPVTAAAVDDIAQTLVRRHPEVQTVILFGSVARHEERPLDDRNPSDVDILLVLDPSALDLSASRLTHTQELALRATIGDADYRHRSPRAISVLFMNRDLEGWDSLFIENVARDGIVLWTRGDVPIRLTNTKHSPVSPQKSSQ